MSEQDRDLPDDYDSRAQDRLSDELQGDASDVTDGALREGRKSDPTATSSESPESPANRAHGRLTDSTDPHSLHGNDDHAHEPLTSCREPKDFEQSLDELNDAMHSGALANKLRGRLQRHTEEVLQLDEDDSSYEDDSASTHKKSARNRWGDDPNADWDSHLGAVTNWPGKSHNDHDGAANADGEKSGGSGGLSASAASKALGSLSTRFASWQESIKRKTQPRAQDEDVLASDDAAGESSSAGNGSRASVASSSSASSTSADSPADDDGAAGASTSNLESNSDSSSTHKSTTSKQTLDFLASLDERFPGVSGAKSGDSNLSIPPKPTEDDVREAARRRENPENSSNDLVHSAESPGQTDPGEPLSPNRLMGEKSKAFIESAAARIAALATERQERKRAKQEAQRLAAEEEEARNAHAPWEDTDSTETGWANADSPDSSAASTASGASVASGASASTASGASGSDGDDRRADDPVKSRFSLSFDDLIYRGVNKNEDDERSDADAPLDSAGDGERGTSLNEKATRTLAMAKASVLNRSRKQNVRRLGDTDSLEAVASDQPQEVKFTRKGAPILRLPSGAKVLTNSMQSVRSTMDALNAGQSIDPTRPTVALFAALLVLATIISATTLLSTGKFGASRSLAQSPSDTTVVTEVTQAPEETEAGDDKEALSTDPAPAIESIEVVSYNKDDGDHPEWAKHLFDGDKATRWQTRYFAQPELPENDTIRLIIHLKEPTTVKGVTFIGPIDGGQVDLRVNDGSDPFGTPVITSSKMSATTKLEAPEPVQGNTVTLNFVSLPTEDEGRYRIKIDELSVQ